jgi:hypothetical protein
LRKLPPLTRSCVLLLLLPSEHWEVLHKKSYINFSYFSMRNIRLNDTCITSILMVACERTALMGGQLRAPIHLLTAGTSDNWNRDFAGEALPSHACASGASSLDPVYCAVCRVLVVNARFRSCQGTIISIRTILPLFLLSSALQARASSRRWKIGYWNWLPFP